MSHVSGRRTVIHTVHDVCMLVENVRTEKRKEGKKTAQSLHEFRDKAP